MLLQKSPSLASLAQAEDTRVQSLWNAAENDEIRMNKQGRLERHEITKDDAEIMKVDPDYGSNTPHQARVTTAKKAVFHPLRWMRNQVEPKAVHSRAKFARSVIQSAREQQLWNAADNDKIRTDSGDSDSPPAIKWLQNQHDEAETSALRSHPRYAFGKSIFSRGQDHARNYGGDYVDDNTIGVKVLERTTTKSPGLQPSRSYRAIFRRSRTLRRGRPSSTCGIRCEARKRNVPTDPIFLP